jgi:hypothetical protein
VHWNKTPSAPVSDMLLLLLLLLLLQTAGRFYRGKRGISVAYAFRNCAVGGIETEDNDIKLYILSNGRA